MAVLPDSFLSIAARTSAYIHSVCQESIIACRKNHFSILSCHYGNQRKYHLSFKKTDLEQPFSVISSLKYSCPTCHPQSFASTSAVFCIVIRGFLHRHLQCFASSFAAFHLLIRYFWHYKKQAARMQIVAIRCFTSVYVKSSILSKKYLSVHFCDKTMKFRCQESISSKPCGIYADTFLTHPLLHCMLQIMAYDISFISNGSPRATFLG